MATSTDPALRRIETRLTKARRHVAALEHQRREWHEDHPHHHAKQIGRRIRQIRGEMNLSQRMLARLASMTPSTLSALELGRRDISTPSLYKICAATGASTDWIMSGDERKRWLTPEERERAVETAKAFS
jgi:DNA-binding transcriptional regulator YiaG